jgi:hypothetical protein
MTGVFKKSIARTIISAALLLFGTAEAAYFGATAIKEIKSALIPEAIFSIAFLFGGIALGIFGLELFSFNKRASLKISDGRIEAEYGFSKSFSIAIIDIIDVTLVLNKLTIETRGDTYEIEGLANASEIHSYLYPQVKPRIDLSHIDEDYSDYKKQTRKTKLLIILTIICVVFLFLNLFLCVILTGERDFPDFTETDKIIFYIFAAVEAVTLILTFISARICGKNARCTMRQNSYMTKAKGKQNRKTGLEAYEKIISIHYYDHYATRILVVPNDDKYAIVIEIYDLKHDCWHTLNTIDEYDTLSELYAEMREIADEIIDDDEE